MLHHKAPAGYDWHSRRQHRAVVSAMAKEATGQADGQLVPGWTVVLRRQPTRIVDGQPQGGYTDAFELICCDCGDDPDLDYRDTTAKVQQIRGPYTITAGIAAYEQHVRHHRRQVAPPGPITRGPGDR